LLLLLLLLLERVRRAVVRLERVAARSATASKPKEAHASRPGLVRDDGKEIASPS
jgi:hypothetical protein